MAFFQLVTRPSPFVLAEKWSEEEACGALWKVRVTGMFAAGRPSVVSRTWHVIGGFFSVAMAIVIADGLAEVERWFERASTRAVARPVGIRGCGLELWSYEKAVWNLCLVVRGSYDSLILKSGNAAVEKTEEGKENLTGGREIVYARSNCDCAASRRKYTTPPAHLSELSDTSTREAPGRADHRVSIRISHVKVYSSGFISRVVSLEMSQPLCGLQRKPASIVYKGVSMHK